MGRSIRVLPPEVFYFLQNPKRIQELDLPLGCDFKNKIVPDKTIQLGKYTKESNSGGFGGHLMVFYTSF